MPDTDHRPLPTRVAPPGAPLGSWGLLRAVLRNPLEAVPAAAYEEPLARQALFGRERVFVSDPELVERVLVGEADAFVKGEVTRRALGPALGEAILTAEGERWRWQRRAVAPIFRHERVLGFLPAMLAAAERRRDQWLALPPGSSVELGREMMRTTFEVIVETMLSGSGGEGDHRGALDVGRIERNITEYLRSTGWAILLALLTSCSPCSKRRAGRRTRGEPGRRGRATTSAVSSCAWWRSAAPRPLEQTADHLGQP